MSCCDDKVWGDEDSTAVVISESLRVRNLGIYRHSRQDNIFLIHASVRDLRANAAYEISV
jgi:hypothetical protein